MSAWDEFEDWCGRAESNIRKLHVYVERDADKPIPHLTPHYTDSRFKEPQTAYLAQDKQEGSDGYVRGASYDYSDRLFAVFHKNEDAARNAGKATGCEPRSATYLQAYLRVLMGKEHLELYHVLAGYNLSTGHPYQVYGYITGE